MWEGDVFGLSVHSWKGRSLFSGGSKEGRKGRAPPCGPKFLHFHAVSGKNWPNNRLAPPFGVSTPSSGKSWIRHCCAIASWNRAPLVPRRTTPGLTLT